MAYDNELKIALFKFDSDNPKAPVFKGKTQVQGVNYDVSVWKQTSAQGKVYLSGALQLSKDQPERQEQPKAKPAPQPKPQADEDDIGW